MSRIFHVIALTTVLAVGAQAIWAQNLDKGGAAYSAGDYETALREWRPLADQGDADAQYWLGTIFNFGQGVLQNYAEAAEWYRLAAAQGHAPA